MPKSGLSVTNPPRMKTDAQSACSRQRSTRESRSNHVIVGGDVFATNGTEVGEGCFAVLFEAIKRMIEDRLVCYIRINLLLIKADCLPKMSRCGMS